MQAAFHPATPGEREEFMVKKNRLGLAGAGLLVLVLAAAVAGGSISRSGSRSEATREHAEGLVAASSEREEREAAGHTAKAASSSFGPNVVNGRFDGVSPAV